VKTRTDLIIEIASRIMDEKNIEIPDLERQDVLDELSEEVIKRVNAT